MVRLLLQNEDAPETQASGREVSREVSLDGNFRRGASAFPLQKIFRRPDGYPPGRRTPAGFHLFSEPQFLNFNFFCRTAWSPTIPPLHDKPFFAIRQDSPARSFHSEEKAEGRGKRGKSFRRNDSFQ